MNTDRRAVSLYFSNIPVGRIALLAIERERQPKPGGERFSSSQYVPSTSRLVHASEPRRNPPWRPDRRLRSGEAAKPRTAKPGNSAVPETGDQHHQPPES